MYCMKCCTGTVKYAVHHRRFQTWASPGIAQVEFWIIVLIAYHYIILRDDGAEPSDSNGTTEQSKDG